MKHPLLFSIDLEWFYAADPRRLFRETPVPETTERILRLLQRHGAKATFFVVGELARKYPELVAAIASEGHEIGCHGDRHLPLDRIGSEAFARDLRENRRALEAAGVKQIRGFRAPLFSLHAKTAWAYLILRDAGFHYSSSVLPAANPLYGWPGFGSSPRRIDGLWELPITVDRIGPLTVPLYGGTYLRVLPWLPIRGKLRRALAERAVLSYAHPYDFDSAQQWIMHAGVRGNRLMNALLYIGRSGFQTRVSRLLHAAGQVLPYGAYLDTLERAA